MKTFDKSFIYTLKEAPHDAETISHQLMVRAGMIRKVASGIYTILPLGYRAFNKLKAIIRDEMNAIHGIECEMPHVIPSDLWKLSGRWDKYGKELLRFSDRADREFCFGPTHEEVITDLVSSTINSYKKLPVMLYQIQTKFRDEVRPRFGLMRGREFLMKDAYSFHDSDQSLNDTYQQCRQAYHNIFKRCGLNFIEANADSGAIGGDVSAEFLVIADTGEDEVLVAEDANYAANTEIAECLNMDMSFDIELSEYEAVDTPNVKTISELTKFLSIEEKQTLKSILVITTESNQAIMLMCRGDFQLNDIKILKVLGESYRMANDDEVQSICGCTSGYIGPVNCKKLVRYIFDYSLKLSPLFVCGANKLNTHLTNVVITRDLPKGEWADIRFAVAGDPCPSDEKILLTSKRGIEVGHIFKLGKQYSTPMGASFNTQAGTVDFFNMGCYGIGVGRTIAAAIEQSHDEHGIIWPKNIAPYDVVIIDLAPKNDIVNQMVQSLYDQLLQHQFDVIVDNRHESAGIKFKDADLIGIPFQIVIGNKSVETNDIDVKIRATGKKETVTYLSIEKIIALFK